jgi:glutamate racemase
MIEHNEVDDQKIGQRISEVLDKGADIIVLACTHFHWIESKITDMAKGKAEVIQPTEAIIRQLKKVLEA